jgi:DNA-binding transcriptional MocR family regulator
VLGRYRIEGRGASEIAASVEEGVAAGALPPGATLPAIRDLAADLGVNPNTVAAAYRLLRTRGVVETAGRRGTRVRARPATTSRTTPLERPPGALDLSTGNPDPALLPPLGAALAAPRRAVRYGDPAVSEALAARARERLAADGVPVDALALTSGALDGIERVLAAHLRPGDRVAVEDPGWANLLDLVAALGLLPRPVGVDDDGPLPADVAAAIRDGARAVVVTVRGQNPWGSAVSAARAAELRSLLGSSPHVLAVEDDHAAEVAGADLHTVTGVTEHWAHVRSAAKAYGPDLRLAVLAGDPTTVDRVQGRLRLGPGWVSHLLQDTVTALWDDPEVAVLLDRATAAYAARRDGLVQALAGHGMRAHGRSGFNVWVPAADEPAAVAGLLAAGYVVAPGSRFRVASPSGIRITTAELAGEEIAPLARAVAAAVRLPRTGRALTATT